MSSSYSRMTPVNLFWEESDQWQRPGQDPLPLVADFFITHGDIRFARTTCYLSFSDYLNIIDILHSLSVKKMVQGVE